MKVNDLNQEVVRLDELNMQDIKDKAKKVKDGVVDATKKAAQVVKDEWNDNVKAFQIFTKKFKGHPVTEEEFTKALNQVFKDNPKLIAIAGIGALPGSAVTLPIAMKVAKKFGIDLVPSKTF